MTVAAARPSRICSAVAGEPGGRVRPEPLGLASRAVSVRFMVLASRRFLRAALPRKAIRPRSALDRYFVGRGHCKLEPFARRLLHRLDQRRMDVGFAADRRRVAERLGDRLEHRLEADALLARARRSARRRSRSRSRCGNAWR